MALVETGLFYFSYQQPIELMLGSATANFIREFAREEYCSHFVMPIIV
jgi:hypothetical protein